MFRFLARPPYILLLARCIRRLENVKVLLKYEAEKELECVRNGQRLRAIDFAKPLLANAEERYVRSRSEHQVYKENT
jgi:hypothetical protein